MRNEVETISPDQTSEADGARGRPPDGTSRPSEHRGAVDGRVAGCGDGPVQPGDDAFEVAERGGTPTFSVVVPAYGTGDVIGDVIDSVRAQSRGDWELVVVDDGSPDDLWRVVQPFLVDPRIHLVRLPENRGVSGARNEGASRCRGRFVTFLDSDDTVEPEFLQLVAARAAACPDVGIVGFIPAVVHTDGSPAHLDGIGSPRPDSGRAPEAWVVHLLSHPFHFRGTTLARDLLEDVGGFDESLWLGEDLELWVRAVLAGRPVAIVERSSYVHRLRDGSLTRRPGTLLRSSLAHLEALDRIATQVPRTPPVADALAAARRPPLAREATARFRDAIRSGDVIAARRHAHRIVTFDPGVWSRLMWAASLLPAPLLRYVYEFRRRRLGLDGPP